MTPHRIIKSEADQPKPLAYLRMYPPGRRRVSGYLVAGVIGGVVALGAAIAAMVAGGMAGR